MCGHVSIYYKNRNADSELINTLTEKISHRGPDDSNYFIKDNIAFGFKRLSIIDLNNGKQPFHIDKKTIIFNGEIYNHQELKEDLKNKGYKFNTSSDTEVLLTSYIEYKEDCLNKLRGMFSFIIYDEESKKIFGARDLFGIKPLYYIQNDDYISFSSEYKALIPLLDNINLNIISLQNYLSFQYVPYYKTMISEIEEVPNGSYFTIENKKLKFTKYAEIKFNNEKKLKKDDIVKALTDSVEHHMIANVEVGTFLSGGIDSTIVTTLASKINPNIKSFSVAFDVDGYSELDIAKKTADALGIENIAINITEKDYINALPKVVYSLDDPLADPSCVGIYFLSQKAKNYVKVVLSGEGSDELFGGYNIYKEYYSIKPFSHLPNIITNPINKFAKSLPDIKGKNYLLRATTPLKYRYIGNAKIFDNMEVKKLLLNYSENNTYEKTLKNLYDNCEKNNYDYVTTMQNIDINTWLEGDILLISDKLPMANSIELRVPFLDKEVLNISKELKLKQKVTQNNTKVFLRNAFKDIIPPHVVNKEKLGFPTPIRVWLKSDLGEYVRNTIYEANVSHLINKDFAFKLLQEHIQGKKDNSRKIWTVFIFCLWYEIFIENKPLESLQYNFE